MIDFFRLPLVNAMNLIGFSIRSTVQIYGDYFTSSKKLSADIVVKTVLSAYDKNQVKPVFVGWGLKGSGLNAIDLSIKNKSSFLLLEDGFIRSVNRNDLSASVCLDSKGIFYDSNKQSDLEKFIKTPLNTDETKRCVNLLELWKDKRISKYNSEPEYDGVLPNKYVLVIDQVLGDESIKYGMASAESFQVMLDSALSENVDTQVLVKLHPDVYTKSGKSHYDVNTLKQNDRVVVVAENCHPVRLIEHASAVYTVTSQMGFEALIHGKKVHTFGMPFYAGWGLTNDYLQAPSRRTNVSLEQLVYSALIRYPRYVDPSTMELCQVEQALSYIALQHKQLIQFSGDMTVIGFSRWKRPFIKKFLAKPGLHFVKRKSFNKVVNLSDNFIIWGSKPLPRPLMNSLNNDQTVIRMEDGFLRSSGLGADLVRPLSLVLDDVGMYYDSTRESRLEKILNESIFSKADENRAKELRSEVIRLGLTKYNVGGELWTRPNTNNKVILVVGQVESDASIEFGSPVVKSNIDLLKIVREQCSGAYIIYKPHPDVTSGLRRQGSNEVDAHEYCDEVVTDVSSHYLLNYVDELHTMTSLMGFEALLRGVAVVCHGMPFYAGWGLTKDHVECDRRSKILSLDELVFGALILYPRYFSFEKDVFIEPEQAIKELSVIASQGVQTRSPYRKVIHFFMVLWKNIRQQDRP